MKNADKIINALRMAFPGHNVELSYNFNEKIYAVFIDNDYVGTFEECFIDNDFDNPEIEIKVKELLKYFSDYLDITYDNKNLSKTEYFIRNAIGKGVREWADESHPNN